MYNRDCAADVVMVRSSDFIGCCVCTLLPVWQLEGTLLFQVPNKTLINSGVTNLTCSKQVAVYMEIEVDASVTPAAIEDLSNRMKAAAASDATLFDQSFEVKAHIQNIVSPLKYQVLHSPPSPPHPPGCRSSLERTCLLYARLTESHVRFGSCLTLLCAL